MRYVIRAARAEEIPELAELFSRAYIENLLKIPMALEDAEKVADMGVRQVMHKAAEYPDLIIHVAEDTEQGVIAAGLAIYVMPALRSSHGIYMWVREEYRGRALFTRHLFRYTEVTLFNRGARRVEFGVLLSNPRALKIYERLGYRSYAVTMVKPLDILPASPTSLQEPA